LLDRPKIVLGLGNPGTRYGSTRHNVGFRVLDRLAQLRRLTFRPAAELSGKAWVAAVESSEMALILAKPRTYMNRSGRAALALCDHYAATPAQLLVVHDDADLSLGRLRLRPEGGAGGHNGLRSLIDALQTESFPRVRLGVRGVGRAAGELSDYVLGPFEPAEEPLVEALVELAAQAVEAALKHGLGAAMNSYNARCASPGDQAKGQPEEGE